MLFPEGRCANHWTSSVRFVGFLALLWVFLCDGVSGREVFSSSSGGAALSFSASDAHLSGLRVPLSEAFFSLGSDNRRLLPRFVSLGSSRVFARRGPGRRFPVAWVYREAGLPLLVSDEYGLWRKVHDPEGDTGWIHRSLLDNRRTFFVTASSLFLHESPDSDSLREAVLQRGVVGVLLECDGDWCRVRVAGLKGWLSACGVFGDTSCRHED